jgi:hypothetical protein
LGAGGVEVLGGVIGRADFVAMVLSREVAGNATRALVIWRKAVREL